jgi:hypothetical protein
MINHDAWSMSPLLALTIERNPQNMFNTVNRLGTTDRVIRIENPS